jgi:hypothetical protein
VTHGENEWEDQNRQVVDYSVPAAWHLMILILAKNADLPVPKENQTDASRKCKRSSKSTSTSTQINKRH